MDIVAKDYIMDPTFRQFCIEDENQLSIFDEKTGWSNYMTVPKPGYFFNLTEEGRTFANKLITYGYFVMTPENIKRYFDAFRLYLTPRDEFYYNDLGSTSTTALTSEYYEDRIEKSIKPNKIPARIHVKTPVEIVTEEQRKILNRLKQ